MLWIFLFYISFVFYSTPKIYDFYLIKATIFANVFWIGETVFKVIYFWTISNTIKVKFLINIFILNIRFYRFIKSQHIKKYRGSRAVQIALYSVIHYTWTFNLFLIFNKTAHFHIKLKVVKTTLFPLWRHHILFLIFFFRFVTFNS